MPKQWQIHANDRAESKSFSRSIGVSPLVAQLLLNRGVVEPSAVETFLSPQLADLYVPEMLPGADAGAEILVDAINQRQKIVLYGDYDVDGTTGIAILWHLLTVAGANVSFYVPHRVEEGYGLNAEACARIVADGADVVVTVDCGIASVDEVAGMKRSGAVVIVTDHHLPKHALPSADAVVHPGLGGYPNKHLCGAGVAFKLAWRVAQRVCRSDRVTPEYRGLLMTLLPLAALGTIADVVPLVGENRIIAKHGLSAIANTSLVGLQALMASAGLSGDRVSGHDVGFKIAPRINAAGRMGHARLAVELLTRADRDRAQEIALYLEDHNKARRTVERKITNQAIEIIDRDNLASDGRRAIVVSGEGWHTGVVGIVAARLVDRYHRPAVVIGLTNGQGQASARSIENFDLAEALTECGEFLEGHGGHAMAAGLRIGADRVPAFAEAFVGLANNRLTSGDLLPKLRIDADVDLPELTMTATEQIAALGPFGTGNPRPRFATGVVHLADEPRCVGKRDEHLSASFTQEGVRLRGIGFGLGDQLEDLKQHRRCRVAFEPMINEFNGRRSVEMQILDLQFPDA